MNSSFMLNNMPCPRCESPLWLIPTEFRFYLPHCLICGFEDYSRTRVSPELDVENTNLPENTNPYLKGNEEAA